MELNVLKNAQKDSSEMHRTNNANNVIVHALLAQMPQINALDVTKDIY